MPDASSLGVTASNSISANAQIGYNKLYASSATAITIGTLTENSSSLNVMSRLTDKAPKDYYTFNFNSGSAIKLAFTNLTDTTTLRTQLLDIAGNVVADSAGTDAQKTAYTNLTSSSGLTASTGQYYVKVSYTDGAAVYGQDYNFQLYSGTTYDSAFNTTALTQPYDPNLFNSASSSVTAASKVNIYTRTATLATTASAAHATSVGSVTANATALNVISKLSSSNPTQNFAVNVDQSGKLKFNITNSTTTMTANLHIKIMDSTGTKVIADNFGTSDQQYAYKQINSGAGLETKKGKYIIQVGYADGQVKTDQKYNFQVYSGTSYRDFYTTTTTATATTTATPAAQKYIVGENVGVYAKSDATIGTRQEYSKIKATVADAINIGWLKENTTSLNVSSRLTKDDNVDYYSFTLQQGKSFKFAFKNTTNDSTVRIQAMDATGNIVLADNQGTKAQKDAFSRLTSDTGLTASSGNYIIKIAHGTNTDKTKTIDYNFQIYSGTKFTAQYKTTASAQTYSNYILSGGGAGSYTANGAAASYLTGIYNGTSTDVITALSTKV